VSNQPYVMRWTRRGRLATKLQVNSKSLFALAVHGPSKVILCIKIMRSSFYRPHSGVAAAIQMLAVCGNSPLVDIFVNPTVLAFSLQFAVDSELPDSATAAAVHDPMT